MADGLVQVRNRTVEFSCLGESIASKSDTIKARTYVDIGKVVSNSSQTYPSSFSLDMKI